MNLYLAGLYSANVKINTADNRIGVVNFQHMFQYIWTNLKIETIFQMNLHFAIVSIKVLVEILRGKGIFSMPNCCGEYTYIVPTWIKKQTNEKLIPPPPLFSDY